MRILIVDDDPMVNSINEKFARKVDPGFYIKTAFSLREAEKYLDKDDFDLVLLDIYFPEGKGTDLLRKIREKEIRSEVILITADKTLATIEKGLNLGIADYIIKPFTYERFREALVCAGKRIKLLNTGEITDQEKLDQLIMKNRLTPMEEQDFDDSDKVIEKGLSYHTLKAVKKVIEQENGDFTAETLGEKAGLARVTVRRYIEYLVKEGFLDMELSYGKVGRPQHFYRMKK